MRGSARSMVGAFGLVLGGFTSSLRCVQGTKVLVLLLRGLRWGQNDGRYQAHLHGRLISGVRSEAT